MLAINRSVCMRVRNNDRFDDTTIYSTGEPKPTGAVIDVGYTVDVGLPPFLVPPIAMKSSAWIKAISMAMGFWIWW